jgi:endoglucanase
MTKKVTNLGLHASRTPLEAKRLRAVEPKDQELPLPRWITLSGMECGSEQPGFCNDARGRLGEDYFINRRPTFERLSEAGFEGFRIPFCWERLQPQLGGPLAPDGIQDLRYMLGAAESIDRKVILSMHNAGRYTMRVDGVPTACGLEESIGGKVRVTAQHFAEFWSRLSHALCGLPNLRGYGLMSAAHDLPEGAWQMSSQSAIDSIREDGDTIPIYVAGIGSSRTSTWDNDNPDAPWINDPEDQVIYEARCYLDHDESGQYDLAFEEELASDPKLQGRAESRLKPFLDWLEASGAKGAITEFGVPCDDHRWVSLLPHMLKTLEKANVQSVWWAAGEHLIDHPLSLQLTEEDSEPKPAQVELFRRA